MRAIIIFGIVAGAAVFLIQKNQTTTQSKVTPIAALATVPREVEVKNLDGSKKLILTGDDSVFVSDEKGRRLLFSGQNLSLPQNAWAPDDAYVFIKQGETFLVFKYSGEQVANINELFAQKLPDNTLVDATGWDGVGLIHVKGDKYSYWFDVASSSFLQLAR